MKKSIRFRWSVCSGKGWSICVGKRWSFCSETGGQFKLEMGGQFHRFFHHCSRASKKADLYQLMSDIQNEVLSLKTGTIARLMHTVSDNFTELDFFVLRSIKALIYE